MSGFINTIDLLGENEVLKQYLDLSLAEFKDDVITEVKGVGFKQRKSLTNLHLPNVITVHNYTIGYCTSLKYVDFSSLTSIGVQSFASNSKMDTFVLRTPTVCALSNVNAFISTPISKGTGYIYVPRALVDTYKTATNWSTYANQFRAIEDYPEICG